MDTIRVLINCRVVIGIDFDKRAKSFNGQNSLHWNAGQFFEMLRSQNTGERSSNSQAMLRAKYDHRRTSFFTLVKQKNGQLRTEATGTELKANDKLLDAAWNKYADAYEDYMFYAKNKEQLES